MSESWTPTRPIDAFIYPPVMVIDRWSASCAHCDWKQTDRYTSQISAYLGLLLHLQWRHAIRAKDDKRIVVADQNGGGIEVQTKAAEAEKEREHMARTAGKGKKKTKKTTKPAPKTKTATAQETEPDAQTAADEGGGES